MDGASSAPSLRAQARACVVNANVLGRGSETHRDMQIMQGPSRLRLRSQLRCATKVMWIPESSVLPPVSSHPPALGAQGSRHPPPGQTPLDRAHRSLQSFSHSLVLVISILISSAMNSLGQSRATGQQRTLYGPQRVVAPYASYVVRKARLIQARDLDSRIQKNSASGRPFIDQAAAHVCNYIDAHSVFSLQIIVQSCGK